MNTFFFGCLLGGLFVLALALAWGVWHGFARWKNRTTWKCEIAWSGPRSDIDRNGFIHNAFSCFRELDFLPNIGDRIGFVDVPPGKSREFRVGVVVARRFDFHTNANDENRFEAERTVFLLLEERGSQP